MRFRGSCGGSAALLAAIIGGVMQAGSAMAAAPQVFPVKPHLVPVLVAAVFVLPAGLAGFLSALRRLRQARSGVWAAGLLLAAVAAVAMYAEPQLLASLRG